MYVIATDEAGYGPRLGPLVVVGTAWQLPGDSLTVSEMSHFFSALATPTRQGDLAVTIDDSKRVYRQGDGLQALHATVSAGLNWCGVQQRTFPGFLKDLCPEDVSSLEQSPWLRNAEPIPLEAPESTSGLIKHWAQTGIDLVAVQARVISARSFNQTCRDGFNKADLLSRATLGLVHDLVAKLPSIAPHAAVYCDRHSGRRYYAAPLQHHFPDWLLRVVEETKQESKYSLSRNESELTVHFTVKGDRFAPVAFSSLVAKYLRERFMESLNAYFASRHDGPSQLKPTAGYPVDADRFLKQIQTTRVREAIADLDLVRMR